MENQDPRISVSAIKLYYNLQRDIFGLRQHNKPDGEHEISVLIPMTKELGDFFLKIYDDLEERPEEDQ